MKYSWDLKSDRLTIVYDPQKTNPSALAKIIQAKGYKVEQVAGKEAPQSRPAKASPTKSQATKPASRPATKASLPLAPLPVDAPAFFKEAFALARKQGRPILIDFWAKWCAPCIAMKRKTFHDPKVEALLKKVELVMVDLDKFPGLAKVYGVVSIPDLFFIDAKGRIQDRLKRFEEARAFEKRMQEFLKE